MPFRCNRQTYSTTHKYTGGMFWHMKLVAKTYPWYSFATKIVAKLYPSVVLLWFVCAKIYPQCSFATICLHQNILGGMFWHKQIIGKLYWGIKISNVYFCCYTSVTFEKPLLWNTMEALHHGWLMLEYHWCCSNMSHPWFKASVELATCLWLYFKWLCTKWSFL